MRTISETIRSHVQANPGWHMHFPVTNSVVLGKRQVVGVNRVPIVAWLITTTVLRDDDTGCESPMTDAFPICGPQIAEPDGDAYAIEAPCGGITEPDGSGLPLACEVQYLNDRLQALDRRELERQA